MTPFKNLSPKNQIIAAVLIVTMFYISLFFILTHSPRVEAQSSQRFKFQGAGKFGWNGELDSRTVSFVIAAICDTDNGNLIYISGSSQSSPAIDKGGCQKNPR